MVLRFNLRVPRWRWLIVALWRAGRLLNWLGSGLLAVEIQVR